MTVATQVKINGAKEAIRAFDELKVGVRRRIIRRATTAGARPMRAAAKKTRQFKDRTGLLRKSLIVKTKTYKNGTTASVIGASRDVRGVDDKGRKVVPANYAHLVEKGHRTAVNPFSGKSERDWQLLRKFRKPPKLRAVESTFVKPRPFLREAFDTTTGQAVDAFARVFESALEGEARKAAKT